MFMEAIDKAHASNKGTRLGYLLSLLIALVFALTIYPTKARAQIIGDLEVMQETPNFRQGSTASTCSTTPT